MVLWAKIQVIMLKSDRIIFLNLLTDVILSIKVSFKKKLLEWKNKDLYENQQAPGPHRTGSYCRQ